MKCQVTHQLFSEHYKYLFYTESITCYKRGVNRKEEALGRKNVFEMKVLHYMTELMETSIRCYFEIMAKTPYYIFFFNYKHFYSFLHLYTNALSRKT